MNTCEGCKDFHATVQCFFVELCDETILKDCPCRKCIVKMKCGFPCYDMMDFDIIANEWIKKNVNEDI